MPLLCQRPWRSGAAAVLRLPLLVVLAVAAFGDSLFAAAPSVSATGGTETTIGESGISYKVHTFTTGGTFTVTNGGNVEYLVVGGGGGGGTTNGGGGGAGGFREGTFTASSTTYSVVVGSGGAVDASGVASSVFSVSAAGGGRGATFDNAPGSGGSGGGGCRDMTTGNGIGGAGNTPSTSPCQGFAGELWGNLHSTKLFNY